MQQRASHFKSRRGCQNCKKRHVKCDEQKPNCANCAVRNVTCVYSGAAAGLTATTTPTTTPTRTATPVTANLQVNTGTANGKIHLNRRRSRSSHASSHSSASPTSSPLTPAPVGAYDVSAAAESSRLLELELMHRWSSTTWRGFYQVPEDEDFLQFRVPRLALENPFLMNALFALAAADISKYTGQESHLRAAFVYNEKGKEQYAACMKIASHETAHPLYTYTVFSASFNFAMTETTQTALSRLIAMFDAILSATEQIFARTSWLPPCATKILSGLDNVAFEMIDPDTMMALDRLSSINHQLHHSSLEISLERDASSHAYEKAIAHLKCSFAEEAKGVVQGYCFSIVPAAGNEFFYAVKRSEPLALLIMMYLGVLMDKAATTARMWWLGSSGRNIVLEVADLLRDTPFTLIPETEAVIFWAMTQVGCCQ